jgi:hypothetical protein
MLFTRDDHKADLDRLRADRRPPVRAIGDNFAFEENVGSDRLAHFERFTATALGLRPIAAEYFFVSVQGLRRDHTPSTFEPLNAPALMSATIEPTQRIARIVRLDDVLSRRGAASPAEIEADFVRLQDALASSPADRSVVDPVVRTLNTYPGARPSFACFKAEVAADLAASDWLARMRCRLGLGHHALAVGEVGHFALMQYTADEVFTQATVAQPFAVPSVLEAHDSEYFLPAPVGQGVGYAVDLNHAAGRDGIREFLHVRLTYHAEHLARVARLTGPTPTVSLAAVRDGHLVRVRARCARPDYGAPMSGEVDE